MHCGSVVLVFFLYTGLSSGMSAMNGLMESKQQFSHSRIGPRAGPEIAQNIPPMQRMPFSDNLR